MKIICCAIHKVQKEESSQADGCEAEVYVGFQGLVPSVCAAHVQCDPMCLRVCVKLHFLSTIIFRKN